MEYNPFHGHIDAKVAEKLEEIGFKRNKYQADHWYRWKWFWPFGQELVILSLDGKSWMYDNGQGTRFWSACYDDLFECIAKGWM